MSVTTTRALRSLALAVVAVGALATTAPAHGVLQRSDPANGARLDVAPRRLVLTFNEGVELGSASLALRGPDGLVPLSALRRGDSASVLAADVTGAIVPGAYEIAWQVVGRDGHPVRGTVRFVVAAGAAGASQPKALGVGPPPLPLGDTAAGQAGHAGHSDTATQHDPVTMPDDARFGVGSPIYVAIRWLTFAAMLAVIGALGLALVVLPQAIPQSRPAAALVARVARAGAAAALMLFAVSHLRLLSQSAALHGTDAALDHSQVLPLLVGTRWGVAWLVHVAGATLALVGFALLARGSRAGRMLAVAGAAAAIVGISMGGHAAAVPGARLWPVAVDAAHVAAAGGWMGTLLMIVVVGITGIRRHAGAEGAALVARLVHAFSPLALLCAGIVVLTGALSGWLHVGSLDRLTTTGYGMTVLGKVIWFTIAAILGAINWRIVRPKLGTDAGTRRLTITGTIELVVGAVIVLVTAILVALPME